MGTLSENQTQEHNKEKNRPGREDLDSGAGSQENAQERLGGQLAAVRDVGPVARGARPRRRLQASPQSHRPSQASAAPGRSPEPTAAPCLPPPWEWPPGRTVEPAGRPHADL